MPVVYTDRTRHVAEQYTLLTQASAQLEAVLGPSAAQVTATWDRAEDDSGRSVYTLSLRDDTGAVETRFGPDELTSRTHIRVRLHQLWGRLLHAQTERSLSQLLGSGR